MVLGVYISNFETYTRYFWVAYEKQKSKKNLGGDLPLKLSKKGDLLFKLSKGGDLKKEFSKPCCRSKKLK